MSTTIEQLEGYVVDAYANFKERRQKDSHWLKQLREEAFERFRAIGFPTTHEEAWRFTNVSSIAQTPFRLGSEDDFSVSQQDLEKYRLVEFACQLVFINGYFAPELSWLAGLPVGLEVSSLAAQIDEDPESIEPHLDRDRSAPLDSFEMLNTAFLQDGAYVHIDRGAVIKDPICLLHVSVSGVPPIMSHPRNLIVGEEGSQAAVIEEYVSLDDGLGFSNAVTELIAGEGAAISHYLVERENLQSFNVSTLHLRQGRDANVSSHSILLGGGLVRNNVHPVLGGEGAECLINGLYVGSQRQHLDNYMLVEHASPHCNSRQFYNGILDEQAHGVFHGRIVVHKQAQKTDAKQTNRNLLLSDDARIDTKPQLEIYADDVKCTHGATIGQLDENALFYLRARGIDEVSARNLLLQAFAGECLDRMHEPALRKFIEGLIGQRLADIGRADLRASGSGHRQPDEIVWEEAG
jgi:Fe-S cluster assembly protein SufD